VRGARSRERALGIWVPVLRLYGVGSLHACGCALPCGVWHCCPRGVSESPYPKAAVTLLKEAMKPLHYKEITNVSIERGMITPTGRTPENTMNGQLNRTLLFYPAGKGYFGLMEWLKLVGLVGEPPPGSGVLTRFCAVLCFLLQRHVCVDRVSLAHTQRSVMSPLSGLASRETVRDQDGTATESCHAGCRSGGEDGLKSLHWSRE
jgi:hypothetical protein